MISVSTTLLSAQQQRFCARGGDSYFVAVSPMNVPEAAKRIRLERARRGWSTTDLANRARAFATEAGDEIKLSQQLISKFEQGDAKRMPSWIRYVWQSFESHEDETSADPYLTTAKADTAINIRLLPTHVGLGAGGTGEGDEGQVSFSRDLIENELRVPPEALLAMMAEGNSMEPDFRGGDQILVDTRRKSLAQPGPFCLWDGDGHVVKFLERVPGTNPPRVRVISANSSLYDPHERLLEEVNIVGRVIWFGRRVQ